eukprot:7387425-Prymnesium_polylepis.1
MTLLQAGVHEYSLRYVERQSSTSCERRGRGGARGRVHHGDVGQLHDALLGENSTTVLRSVWWMLVRFDRSYQE